MKHAIFILGMHRSGTSAMARVINLLGVELGSHLMQAADDNQKGFFEHEPIVQIHEQLLNDLGISWQDAVSLPENWLKSDAAIRASKAIGAIIDTDFADSELWGLKDPRQCRLMPLWLPLLKERDIKPHFIIAYRHPTEVAASLASRDDMPLEPALSAWLCYTLEAFLATKGLANSILSYDNLLSDWQPEMQRIAKELKLEWKISPDAAADEINGFLSPNLRHHKSKSSKLPDSISECLKLLKKPNYTTANKLYKAWQNEASTLAPLLRKSRQDTQQKLIEINGLQHQLARAEHRSNDLATQLKDTTCAYVDKVQQLEQVIDSIYASSSWKITKPLRQARAALERKELANQDDNS